ncbi:MAG: hypothetical protein Q9168_004273 [Polycauliona sp. 1 TL-2023]
MATLMVIATTTTAPPKLNLMGTTDGAMHEAVAAIADCGVSPLVRTAGNKSWMIKRPLLNTVKDAESLVSSAKLPPAGQRGFGSPFAMQDFGRVTQTEYLQQANESLLTIVQIETRGAFKNVVAKQHCIRFGRHKADKIINRRHSPGSRDRRFILRAVQFGQQHWPSDPGRSNAPGAQGGSCKNPESGQGRP